MGMSKKEKHTHLTQDELTHFRQLLLDKRTQSLGNKSTLGRAALDKSSTEGSLLTNHPADRGSESGEQNLLLTMMEEQKHLIEDIDDALERIEEGTFGLCEGTGDPIGKARLEAMPWARYSKRYQEQKEAEGRLP